MKDLEDRMESEPKPAQGTPKEYDIPTYKPIVVREEDKPAQGTWGYGSWSRG